MKHASTKALFAYWNQRRGSRPAPERVDIEPTGLRRELGDVFMLATDFADNLRFRLAGTRVCALFCREIKGETFATAWDAESRGTIDELAAIITHERIGAVAGLTGYAADGDAIDLEMILLPLAHSGHARIRAIGVLAPMAPPYWLGEKPLETLRLGALRHVEPESERLAGRRFASAARQKDIMDEPRDILSPPVGNQLRHGFVVYDGGRATQADDKAG
ncbi:MAG TPA: PAS domain-containing protein [Rhizomicrobium sp.]